MGVFDIKIQIFKEISIVLDSIWYALVEYIHKIPEFSTKSYKIFYGQVHFSIINEVCSICAAVNGQKEKIWYF